MKKSICLLLFFISYAISCYASPRKDANGNYMVKSITWVYNGNDAGVYNFSYNALNEIVRVEFAHTHNSKARNVLSRYDDKVIFKQYDDEGKQDPDFKYDYTLDDNGQIIFISMNDRSGGCQLKIQNDYYYEDGKLVYAEYHEYRADNLTDKPKLFLDSYHSMSYDYPDGDIWATQTTHNKEGNDWYNGKGILPKPDIEYWDIVNNINVELSALYFRYSPYPIRGNDLAFLSGWMKLRSAHLVSKYGSTIERTRLEYELDAYNRPIKNIAVADIPNARFADTSTVYRIEYIDD